MIMGKIELPRLRLSTKSTISGQIYVFLRSQITTAFIKPGTVLSENELSTHFKVSRQPVREAFNSLEHDGLISIIPQKGTIVKKISISDLRQVVFIRTALECSSIDNAKNLSAAKFGKIIKRLKANIEEQRTKVDPENLSGSFLPLDDRFHELLCSFSECPMTWEAVQAYKSQLDRIRYLSMGTESPIDALVEDHNLILQMIEKGELDKAKAQLSNHLHEVMQTHIAIKERYAQWFEEDE